MRLNAFRVPPAFATASASFVIESLLITPTGAGYRSSPGLRLLTTSTVTTSPAGTAFNAAVIRSASALFWASVRNRPFVSKT